jgi:hypothetical protein
VASHLCIENYFLGEKSKKINLGMRARAPLHAEYCSNWLAVRSSANFCQSSRGFFPFCIGRSDRTLNGLKRAGMPQVYKVESVIH